MADDTIPVETQQVFDISQGKFIDKPIEKEPTPSSAAAEDSPYNKPSETTPTETPVDTPPADKPEDKPTDTPPADKPTDLPAFEPGTYLKDKYSEKYGVESESDLDDILSYTEQTVKDLDELKAKYSELEKKPAFRSEQEEKIAKFLAPYDPSKFGEGLKTAASIMAVENVDNLSSKTALELAYIISHPNLTEDEAREMFNDQHEKKYLINKEDFDTEEAFTKRKRILDIQMKDEESQAKNVLKTKREELKAKPAEEKPINTATDQKVEIPAEAIEPYKKEVDKFFAPTGGKPFDRFNILSDDKKDILFSIVLDKDKIADLKGFMDKYVKNPVVYNKDKKIDNFVPQDLVKTATRILHGDWYDAEMLKNVKTLAAKLKAEQIASTTPDKRSTGTGEVKLDASAQFQKLADDAKAARKR